MTEIRCDSTPSKDEIPARWTYLGKDTRLLATIVDTEIKKVVALVLEDGPDNEIVVRNYKDSFPGVEYELLIQ